MKLIDIPRYIPQEKYDQLIEKLVCHLSSFSQIQSIYQIGSIKNLGISDLDILCVFKDNDDLSTLHLPELTIDEKYILTHQLFGIRESELKSIQNLNFYTNYHLLSGKDLLLGEPEKLSKELKTQIALEFLIMFYLSLDRQNYSKVFKLRAFLLEAKAIDFDLNLLGITDGKLHDLVKKVQEIRKDFFSNNYSQEFLSNLIQGFYLALRGSIKDLIKTEVFYLPKTQIRISKNMIIRQSDKFSVDTNGLKIPSFLSFFGKTFFKVQNKLLTHIYDIPFELPTEKSMIDIRFQLFSEIHQSNRLDYPKFIPLTSKLKFY